MKKEKEGIYAILIRSHWNDATLLTIPRKMYSVKYDINVLLMLEALFN